MAQFDVVNLKNEKVGTVDLPDNVFGQKVNQPLVLQVIKAQLAGMRQGTAATKTKSAIRGGGKKPFKQKGTGNARQGSSRSPLMPGGGSAHGPVPRCYHQSTPKKMVRGAMKSVLSDKALSKRLVVLDAFQMKAPKTKTLSETLAKAFKVSQALLVDQQNMNLKLASQNLPKVKYVDTNGVNTYDMVKHEWLFLTKDSALALAKQLG